MLLVGDEMLQAGNFFFYIVPKIQVLDDMTCIMKSIQTIQGEYNLKCQIKCRIQKRIRFIQF